ncbi:MAG: SRPBCC family protein [Bdellovibrionales bacterium]|nr:SRPBCC family protein [Bdellovibrionales bacterium]
MKKIALAFVSLLAVILLYAAFKSPRYEISREITINASPDKIFPYLNNSRLADQWGPWKEVDPAAKMEITGPDAGVGSKTSWDGGKQLGTGSATIVESVPNERVGIKLEYTKPMVMTQDSLYLVRAAGNQSVVTWKVTGENTFMGRLMCIFVNMDKVVGGMFEKGLSNLKKLVESTHS